MFRKVVMFLKINLQESTRKFKTFIFRSIIPSFTFFPKGFTLTFPSCTESTGHFLGKAEEALSPPLVLGATRHLLSEGLSRLAQPLNWRVLKGNQTFLPSFFHNSKPKQREKSQAWSFPKLLAKYKQLFQSLSKLKPFIQNH